MNATTPALIAMWPTMLRNAEAVPQLNQPPCRWRTAAPFRACVGMAHQPDMPPTASASKLTPSGAATRSMMPLNEPRAETPSSLPFMAATVDLRVVIAAESSGLRGWITDQDSLIAVFSGISACIDFSFDFWRWQGIVSPRSSPQRRRVKSRIPLLVESHEFPPLQPARKALGCSPGRTQAEQEDPSSPRL